MKKLTVNQKIAAQIAIRIAVPLAIGVAITLVANHFDKKIPAED
jgi:hypothetical protein